ncbi:hypothetical protein CMI47_12685 [Candidatus Pacearchaeota archaeon]|nr:hypothetical protein [Candidatus Pacearchaeota archaeon]|tara:strand:+ start:1196 stop:1819 length:624 start_codon:yes stop_codon:yes gene_type:complete
MPNAFALDKNRVKYSYLKANIGTKTGLEKKITEKIVVTSFIASDMLEIDFGVEVFTASNSQTITSDITFSEIPTVIAIPDDNVNMSISATTTSITLHSSDIFTGNVYWIAINKTTIDGDSSARDVAMLVDTGTTTVTSSNSTSVTFTKKNDFQICARAYNLTPIILVSASKNVNLYISNVTPEGFTLNASEEFTGTVYWTALMIRKL